MTSSRSLTLSAATCLPVLVGFVLLLAFTAAAQERTPLITFSGDGDHVTEPFTVGDAWSVEWSTKDERIDIILKETGSGIPSYTANPVDPGEGRSVYARGGTYQFEIRAQGPWRIAVFDE